MKANPANSYLERLVSELIRPRRSLYSEESLASFLQETGMSIEDLPVTNHHGEKLKCSFIQHNPQPRIQTKPKCVLYLHGLGSTRLEALSLATCLPSNYSLCTFDLSGNGKSQGEMVTYGAKEHEDIPHVLAQLNKMHSFEDVILWGRSMGAVAALLHLRAISAHPPSKCIVKCVVMDSPFSSFRDVSKFIALNRMMMPQFLIDIALDYVEEAFTKLLQTTTHNYNPFKIDLLTSFPTSIPAIFLYSEHDQIVPPSHSENILKNYKGKFERFLLNQCTHNQARPDKIIRIVFRTIEKFTKQAERRNQRFSETVIMHRHQSVDRRRGIKIFTPSKPIQNRQTLDETNKKQRYSIFTENTEDAVNERGKQKQVKSMQANRVYSTITSYPQDSQLLDSSAPVWKESGDTTDPDQYRIRLGMTRKKQANNSLTNSRQMGALEALNTIDTSTNILISKRLVKKEGKDLPGRLFPKPMMYNRERIKEVRLTHQRYLQ